MPQLNEKLSFKCHIRNCNFGLGHHRLQGNCWFHTWYLYYLGNFGTVLCIFISVLNVYTTPIQKQLGHCLKCLSYKPIRQGQSSTRILLLWSHTVVIDAVWCLALPLAQRILHPLWIMAWRSQPSRSNFWTWASFFFGDCWISSILTSVRLCLSKMLPFYPVMFLPFFQLT